MNKKSALTQNHRFDALPLALRSLICPRVAAPDRPSAYPVAQFHPVELASGEILRLDHYPTAQGLEILVGTVWLTETPASIDHVLSAGKKYQFSHARPVIIEALSPAKLILYL